MWEKHFFQLSGFMQTQGYSYCPGMMQLTVFSNVNADGLTADLFFDEENDWKIGKAWLYIKL